MLIVGGHISLEPICNGSGYIVRHHPDGKGYGSAWDFAAVVEHTYDIWTVRAGWGKFSRPTYRRIGVALGIAGVPALHWQRDDGRQVRISL